MIIVIGGDDNYKDEDEENRTVLSRWAWRKVSSQFDEEYIDGRKSFIFSWDKKHREIHEEALLHYFDPSKKGQKFEPQPKVKTPPLNQAEEDSTSGTTDQVNRYICLLDNQPNKQTTKQRKKTKLSLSSCSEV